MADQRDLIALLNDLAGGRNARDMQREAQRRGVEISYSTLHRFMNRTGEPVQTSPSVKILDALVDTYDGLDRHELWDAVAASVGYDLGRPREADLVVAIAPAAWRLNGHARLIAAFRQIVLAVADVVDPEPDSSDRSEHRTT